MAKDAGKTEPKLLVWATGSGEPPSELVTAVAHEFKLEVRFCMHDDVLDVVRGSRCVLVGVELGTDPRPGIDVIKKLHERTPQLTILAASHDMNVTVLRIALD